MRSRVGINLQLTYSLHHLCADHRTTLVPSAGSRISHWQSIFSFLNLLMILSAISSKLLVANAKIVGPAPERQTPNNPS